MNGIRRLLLPLFLAAIAAVVLPLSAFAATDPLLGTSGNYAVIASSSITDAGASWITGKMALDPGTSITGFPPATSGPRDVHPAPAALTARNDATTAYNNAAAEPGCSNTGVELGSQTLGPGLYCNGTMGISAGLTLTLNGGGIYIFQVGTTIITGASARVLLINGAQPCDIFWQVGSSATLGASTAFEGTILAHASITMVTAATLNGRAFAGVGNGGAGAVSLDTNRIIQPGGCPGGFTTSYPPPAFVAPPAGTLLPATLGIPSELLAEIPWLLVIGIGTGAGALALGISARRRRRRTV